MKTSLSPVLKAKKNDLDKQEVLISKINQEIHQKFDEISLLQSEMHSFFTPQTGTIQDFKILQEQRATFLFQIDFLHEQISSLKAQRKQAQNLYQQLYKEYEKINYIHNEEIKKYLMKIKKQEEKNLDEVATILFKKKENA
ncbi:flagellar export protein FliJ [Helicobacter anatolicus]|uniref:flagellar export protein FliJ n=1 Tax=Helicobacter anatolicus TaxID=2905874 RepID=UPI001E44464A|nr:flagellar export protein FliJ [Helicobacter anatolicus]MCE3037675.1 flagellar export protein FliJ [Helicobacter anatolicus]